MYGSFSKFATFTGSLGRAYTRITMSTQQTNAADASRIANPHMLNRKKGFFERLWIHKELTIIGVAFLVYMIIFQYIPIWGWLMAFTDYNPGLGILGSEWVGLEHFRALFGFERFWRAFRNTLAMSMLNMLFGTLAAIVLALAINEMKLRGFKRTIQTVSYLPHFVSWVVAANIVLNVLSVYDGVVNRILVGMGIIDQPVLWMGRPEWFWIIIALSNTWKTMGFSSIVYLAAMAGIHDELYEAAAIDGAGRLRRIWHITLPGIMPTFVILIIIRLGHLLNAGFEQQLLLGNDMVNDVAEVIPIFVLRFGLIFGRFSFSTASGIFQSFIAVLMILIANAIARKTKQEALF
jgi:putative aldouronate transport system permease protein